jgi:thiol-disulfide isomerase/thioredoxin
VAASTALALGAAVGTYVVLDDDDPQQSATTVSLTPDDTVDPDEATFTTFDGVEVPLTSLDGAPTVVNFFASTCAPCVKEMPAIEEVYQELGDEVAFLGLAVQDRTEDAAALVDQTGVTYPTALDQDGSVLTELGAGTLLPTTVLLDEEGAVVTTHTGELDADELRALLADDLGVGS